MVVVVAGCWSGRGRSCWGSSIACGGLRDLERSSPFCADGLCFAVSSLPDCCMWERACVGLGVVEGFG